MSTFEIVDKMALVIELFYIIASKVDNFVSWLKNSLLFWVRNSQFNNHSHSIFHSVKSLSL